MLQFTLNIISYRDNPGTMPLILFPPSVAEDSRSRIFNEFFCSRIPLASVDYFSLRKKTTAGPIQKFVVMMDWYNI